MTYDLINDFITKSINGTKLRHEVCVFSMEDLSTIIKSGGTIINKVMTENDSAIGIFCKNF